VQSHRRRRTDYRRRPHASYHRCPPLCARLLSLASSEPLQRVLASSTSSTSSTSPITSTTIAIASPPATPPAELLLDHQSWRFIDTGAPCEWAEDYRPGGLHPVNLGDTFCDGKYKVI
jgi:hypothetical protein